MSLYSIVSIYNLRLRHFSKAILIIDSWSDGTPFPKQCSERGLTKRMKPTGEKTSRIRKRKVSSLKGGKKLEARS